MEYADTFTRTLFVTFAPSAPLQAFSDALKNASQTPCEYTLNPHLSLLYHSGLSDAEKQRLARSVSVPLGELRFDALAAVWIPSEPRGKADVEQWRILARQPLL